jgi:hypothetical protein
LERAFRTDAPKVAHAPIATQAMSTRIGGGLPVMGGSVVLWHLFAALRAQV